MDWSGKRVVVIGSGATAVTLVGIGSYPAVTSGADHRVRVTVEGAEAERVELVVARLRSELPEGAVLRVE